MRVAALLLLMLWNCMAQAEPALSIITLKHRFAQDLLSAVQPLVGPDGSVSAVDNLLLVRASPERLQSVQQAVAALDVEREMLRITLSRSRRSDENLNGIRGSGSARRGEVEVQVGSQKRSAAEIEVRQGLLASREDRQEFINVVEGAPAVIAVGQVVPYTQTWVLLTRRYAMVQQSVEFQEISTGFSVMARPIGDQVELQIAPRISDLRAGGVVEFESLSTTVRLSRGQWLDLGGVMAGRDEVSREILSYRSRGGADSSRLLLRVD